MFLFQYNSYITKYEELPKEFIEYTKCFWDFIRKIPEKYEYIPTSITELDNVQNNKFGNHSSVKRVTKL